MQMRPLGTTNMHVSAIGLGAGPFGGTWWGGADDDASIRTIHAALDAGINLIDTAPLYGFGRSETVVGKAIRGRRDTVLLASKVGHWWHDDRGEFLFEQDGHRIHKILTAETIRQELEWSLRRLGTAYIDLYQTHTPTDEPISETMECLLRLKEEGKIRAIGASNVNLAQIKEYEEAGKLDAIQPRYSLLQRDIETDTLPHCLDNHVGVHVYFLLEMGLLTGKVSLDRVFPAKDARATEAWFTQENRKRILDLLAGWDDLTEKYDCTYAQLVIAWTIGQPGVTVALCGARNPEQAIQNAGAGAICLSEADCARMSQDASVLLAEKESASE